MNVLITGGLGTIGTYLTDRCVKAGHQVTVIDNLSLGKVENLDHLLDIRKSENLEIIQASISDLDILDSLMSRNDICYHLAAYLGTISVVKNPVKLVDINIKQSHDVIESASKHGTYLVTPSTSMVYGNPVGNFDGKKIVDEEDDLFVNANLNKRLWWYAVTKMADEVVMGAYFAENRIKGLVVRPFNVVSPIQRGKVGFVIPRFIQAARKNEPLLVYGDGSQKRTFTWVNDFVDSLVSLVNKEVSNTTVNIGSIHETSIIDLAHLVIEKTGSRSQVSMIDPSSLYDNQFVEIQERVPSTARLKELIGVESINFRDIDYIVDKFIEHYDN